MRIGTEDREDIIVVGIKAGSQVPRVAGVGAADAVDAAQDLRVVGRELVRPDADQGRVVVSPRHVAVHPELAAAGRDARDP